MNEYSNTIKDYVDVMKSEFKDNLSLLFMIGSSCSNKVINGWSDIDSVIVLKKYNELIMRKISKIANSFPVKIGVTIYSDKELNNMEIDQKTYYHLYLAEMKEIEIQYKRKNFELPIISFDEVKRQYVANFYSRLHLIKRFFFYNEKELDKSKVRSLYKNVYLILKDILVIDGFKPKNYDDVFKMYSRKYNFEYYDYEKFIQDYMIDDNNYLNIIDYAKKVLFSIIK